MHNNEVYFQFFTLKAAEYNLSFKINETFGKGAFSLLALTRANLTRLRWRAEKRKYKMSDSEKDVMLIGLYRGT